MEQIRQQYNEQAYNDASQQTKDHRQLHQTDNSMRKLMSMQRKLQCFIWRLNIRCPTYSQVTTGQPLRCRLQQPRNIGSVIARLWDIGNN